MCMRMQRRLIRIGELAERLNVENFVIRFWEKEFKVKSHRSPGGQRFYDEADLGKFQHIKELLYEKGFTIAGAKKALKDPAAILGSHKTTMEDNAAPSHQTIIEELIALQKHLIRLKELL